MAECARAYNDFILDFISVDPSRFIPICVAPLWDVDLAVKVAFWFEQLPASLFEQVGIENIVFETDFPHPTSIWKDEVREHVARGLGGQTDEVREAVLSSNARRVYALDGSEPR